MKKKKLISMLAMAGLAAMILAECPQYVQSVNASTARNYCGPGCGSAGT